MIAESLDCTGDTLNILIVDDHPLFREALNYAVKAAYPDATICECSDIYEAQQALTTRPSRDLALLDLKIPGAKGFDGLMRLRTSYPHLPIVIVSGLEDPEIVEAAMSYGIAGFIPKSTKKGELTTAIMSVIDGQIYLPNGFKNLNENIKESRLDSNRAAEFSGFTPQQLKVIGLIRDGLLNKQIAYELGVSETTVKAHVSKILKKLGATNRTQAAMEIEKLNLSDLIDNYQWSKSH